VNNALIIDENNREYISMYHDLHRWRMAGAIGAKCRRRGVQKGLSDNRAVSEFGPARGRSNHYCVLRSYHSRSMDLVVQLKTSLLDALAKVAKKQKPLVTIVLVFLCDQTHPAD
jgi:hypothetical protein